MNNFWFIGLMLFSGDGYTSVILPTPLNSEAECRTEAAKLGLPEMPPPIDPVTFKVNDLPNKGWICEGPKN